MEYYVANVRVATGAPDTRNKILMRVGRYVDGPMVFEVLRVVTRP